MLFPVGALLVLAVYRGIVAQPVAVDWRDLHRLHLLQHTPPSHHLAVPNPHGIK